LISPPFEGRRRTSWKRDGNQRRRTVAISSEALDPDERPDVSLSPRNGLGKLIGSLFRVRARRREAASGDGCGTASTNELAEYDSGVNARSVRPELA